MHDAPHRPSGDFRLGRGRFLVVQIWTVARIPAAICFALVALSGSEGLGVRIAGLLLLGLIELTDLTDGMMARSMGVVSPFGAMLDPFADSVSRLIVYWSLGQIGLLYTVVVLVMALRDVVVAYSRIVLAGAGRSVSARLGGKVKAWVQALGAFAAWSAPLAPAAVSSWSVDVVSWLVMIVTVYSARDYLRDAMPVLLDRG